METTARNINNEIKIVRHAELKRADPDSLFRSWCPVCNVGLLMVSRHQDSMVLSKLDHCCMCAQPFFYEEDEIAGQPLTSPFPTTLEEAVDALDKLISAEDREFIQNTKLHPDELATTINHSLGRHLRNTWRLWHGSPLALHLKTKHWVHPDDMSHHIIVTYCRRSIRTAWQRILEAD